MKISRLIIQLCLLTILCFNVLQGDDSCSWQKVNHLIPAWDNYSSIAARGNKIMMSGMLGFYISNDLGSSFAKNTDLQSMYSISMIDSLHAMCAGSNGLVAFTNDGGETWTKDQTGGQKRFKSSAFPSLNVAYAAGESLGDISGYFYRYDCRETPEWKKIDVQYMVVTIEAMHFFDDTSGYICGNGDFIWHTTDGGISWIKDSYPAINKSLNDIFFINRKSGWTVGKGGDILHWDGSEWIKQESGTDLDIYSVHFLTDQTGWAVGEKGLILKTTNAGKQWERQAEGLSTNCLKSVFAINKDLIFACGDNNELLAYRLISCNKEDKIQENAKLIYSNGCLSFSIVSVEIRDFNLFDYSGKSVLKIGEIYSESYPLPNIEGGLYFWSAIVDGKRSYGKFLIER